MVEPPAKAEGKMRWILWRAAAAHCYRERIHGSLYEPGTSETYHLRGSEVHSGSVLRQRQRGGADRVRRHQFNAVHQERQHIQGAAVQKSIM